MTTLIGIALIVGAFPAAIYPMTRFQSLTRPTWPGLAIGLAVGIPMLVVGMVLGGMQ